MNTSWVLALTLAFAIPVPPAATGLSKRDDSSWSWPSDDQSQSSSQSSQLSVSEDEDDGWSGNRFSFTQSVQPAPTVFPNDSFAQFQDWPGHGMRPDMSSPQPTPTASTDDFFAQFQDWPGYGMRPDMLPPQPTQSSNSDDEYDGWSGNRFSFIHSAQPTPAPSENDSFAQFQDWPGYGIRPDMGPPQPPQPQADDEYDGWSGNRFSFTQSAQPTPTAASDDSFAQFQDWPGYGMRPNMSTPQSHQQPEADDQGDTWAWSS